jgi:hypothetical protein
VQGGSNWYSPSYSPRTKLMYVSTWEDQGMLFGGVPVVYQEGGRGFGGGNLSRSSHAWRSVARHSRSAGSSQPAPWSDQQLDRCRRPRFGAGDRPEHGRSQVEVRMYDVNRHRRGDDGNRIC